VASSTLTRLEVVQRSSVDILASIESMKQAGTSYHSDTTSQPDALLTNSTTNARELTMQLKHLLHTTGEQSEHMLVLGSEQVRSIRSVEANIISHLNRRDATLLQQISLMYHNTSYPGQIPIRTKRRKVLFKKAKANTLTITKKTKSWTEADKMNRGGEMFKTVQNFIKIQFFPIYHYTIVLY
jgi:hypothetical protein